MILSEHTSIKRQMKSLRHLLNRFYPDDAVLKNFMKGSFWAVYGNVVVKGASLLASILIARLLGSSNFGELAVIKTTLSVFSLFATFGLGVSITKFVAESRKNNVNDLGNIISAANTITISTGLFLGLLLVVFAPVISIRILHAESLVTPLRISGVYLFFNALNVYQVGVIAGLEAFRELARINLIIGIITLPVLLTTTYLLGLNGTLAGLTINLIVNWFLNKLLIRKRISELNVTLSYKSRREDILLLLRFSYPLALKEIIYSLSGWVCIYLLLVKTDYGQVGIFNSANQLSQLILFLPASILSVFLALLSNQLGDRQNFNKLVRKNILFNVATTAIIGVVLVLLSKVIYQFYGETYAGGEYVLYILIAATIPMSVIGVFEQVCISNSRPGLVTYFQLIIQMLILITLFGLFYFNSSATSLAFAFLAGNLVAMTVMYIYLRKIDILN
jgi:O-antigen/teichoic acid export membrane protein